jgi:DNA-binding CsgD family transcriptional regulator
MTSIGSLSSPERARLACELWGEGISCTKVGERLGVSRGTVMGRLYRIRRKFDRQWTYSAFAEALANGRDPASLDGDEPIGTYGLAELRRALGRQAR